MGMRSGIGEESRIRGLVRDHSILIKDCQEIRKRARKKEVLKRKSWFWCARLGAGLQRYGNDCVLKILV